MAEYRIKNGDELYDENNRLVGMKHPDGAETFFVSGEKNPTTGGPTWTAAEFAAITPEAGRFYIVDGDGIYNGSKLISYGMTNPYGIKNLKRTNSARFIAKLYAAKTGGSPVAIARVGDSTTAGAGAGTSANGSTSGMSGAFSGAPMQLLAASLHASGKASVSTNSFFCNQYTDTTSYSNYDLRINLGSWYVDALTQSLGGYVFVAVSNNATLSFQTSGTISKIRLFTNKYPGLGSFDVRVNGSVVGTIDESGDPVSIYTDYSFTSVDSPIITIVSKSSNAVYLLGLEAWGSENNAVSRQFGHWGGLVSALTDESAPWSALSVVDVYKNDLTIINMTINDACSGTTKSGYIASLEKFIQRALKWGDVWLELGAISGHASSTDGSLYEIQSAVNNIAETYDLPVISFPAITKSYAQAEAAGYMFDALHPSPTGYAVENDLIFNAFNKLI